MKRVILIQHESYEVLGTLDPLLKREGVRIRYVNFERSPEASPSLDGYDALLLLGGYMGVYESHRYGHLKTEMKLVEDALKKGLPILGICLGSQILAHVLGANVRKHSVREMGWYDLHLTELGCQDPVMGHFEKTEKVFQSHGDTFDIPESAVHLASSDLCNGQAFRYGENAYGLQFHLEVDQTIVEHWLEMPENVAIFKKNPKQFQIEKIKSETCSHIKRSMALSMETFQRFLKVGGKKERPLRLGSGHRA